MRNIILSVMFSLCPFLGTFLVVECDWWIFPTLLLVLFLEILFATYINLYDNISCKDYDAKMFPSKLRCVVFSINFIYYFLSYIFIIIYTFEINDFNYTYCLSADEFTSFLYYTSFKVDDCFPLTFVTLFLVLFAKSAFLYQSILDLKS